MSVSDLAGEQGQLFGTSTRARMTAAVRLVTTATVLETAATSVALSEPERVWTALASAQAASSTALARSNKLPVATVAVHSPRLSYRRTLQQRRA